MTQSTPPTPESELVARLREIESRANAATLGPWTSERQDGEDGCFYFAVHGHLYEWIVNVEEDKNLGVTMKNAEFIAHAREDIPFLLATIERLDSELRLCRAALLAERMCADILEDGAEERLHSAHEHPDDLAVDRFAAALKAKLTKKRAEGRGGWDDPEACDVSFLAKLLFEHLPKGDPVDIGNLAMMLFNRDGGADAIREYRSSAHEQGRREGIEMAAKVCDDMERAINIAAQQR